MIEDRRESHEMDARIFVVMYDKFMSGWGGTGCPARSFLVVACPNTNLAEQVAYHAEHRRTEMKRVSIRYGTLKSALSSRRLRGGDHASVIGVNSHWLGWPFNEVNESSIKTQWKEASE